MFLTAVKEPVAILKSSGTTSLWKRIWKYKFLYALILPGMAFYIIFSYIPMYGLSLAFEKYAWGKSFFEMKWVWFANFEYLFRQADFWRAFNNSLIIGFLKLVTGFFPPIILAILLNELRIKHYKKFIQSVLYLPYFLSWIIIAGIIYSLFSVTGGVYGKMLLSEGIKADPILGNPLYFRWIVYISDIWKYAGWGTIIYLAAIAGVNVELYESAIIDGANRFQQMWHITLPSIKFTALIILIINCGYIMEAGFDQIFNLYSEPVYKVGDIIDTYVYRLGIRSAKYDISTAAGLFKSTINCCMLLVANWIVKLFGEEGFY